MIVATGFSMLGEVIDCCAVVNAEGPKLGECVFFV